MKNAGAKLQFGSIHHGVIPEWDSLRPKSIQVHGIRCVEIKTPAQDCGDADAYWTQVPGIWVGINTADCVPILLEYRDEGETKAVGAIHAGWRGAMGRIVLEFFKTLPPALSNPKNWHASIGPSIHACCYEVSEDLIVKFTGEFPHMTRKQIEPEYRKLNLVEVVKEDLILAGVGVINADSQCTFCTLEGGKPKYFSYRRGDRLSRQFSIISF